MDFDQQRKKKRLDPIDAKTKVASFCAYQERSEQQVRNKLADYGLAPQEVEEVLSELVLHEFVDQERFAKAYVRGKFRIKQWGRHKIIEGLRQHDLSEHYIKKGFEEIEDVAYLETLKKLIIKKADSIKNPNEHGRRNKIVRYAVSRGFETAFIWNIILSENL